MNFRRKSKLWINTKRESTLTSLDDQKYMARALRLAERGRYSTHPNPCVGCVIVREGKIVGEGYHVMAGKGHAEANALREAGELAKESTVYVTLEPCSFEGRTPSCADALIKAGVSRVVAALKDPDHRNAGKGFSKLKQAGIAVDIQPSESAVTLVKGHLKRHIEGKPFIRLKLAMSLDGKTALNNGLSKWITSEAARADVQKLRAQSSAIVTGVQTVIDDDPSLKVRAGLPGVDHRADAVNLVRPVYILDSNLRIPLDSQLLENRNTVIVCIERTRQLHHQHEVIEIQSDQGRVCLNSLVKLLAKREHSEVLFECGATLGGAMIAAGLVDELVIYAAPILIGAGGRSLISLPEIDRMADRINLTVNEVRMVGEDLRITAKPS